LRSLRVVAVVASCEPLGGVVWNGLMNRFTRSEDELWSLETVHYLLRRSDPLSSGTNEGIANLFEAGYYSKGT
jgi:hypothetical protein